MWFSTALDRLAELTARPRSAVRSRLPVRLLGRRSSGRPVPLPRAGRGEMRLVFEQAVVHDTASRRSRLLQRGMRLVLKPMLIAMPVSDRSIRAMRRAERWSSLRPHSRYVVPVEYQLAGVRVEQMTHRYGPSSDMTILYLHGGGFFSCGIDSHRRICERLALRTGATVVSVDYVQLPDGTVADSVQDAIDAYTALVKQVQHPDKIVVAGDSAGGYLTMKVAELATRRRLPRPAALLGFSPLLSLDPDSTEKGIQQVVRAADAYLPLGKIAKIRPRWMPEGAQMEGETSPLDATRWISSPTFMVAAEDEILRPEVEAMALLLSDRGVEVETHLWRGQVHAFPVLATTVPEADLAIRLAADFARRAAGELDQPAVTDDDADTELIAGEVSPDDAA